MLYKKEFHLNDAEELTDDKLLELIKQHRALALRYVELENMYKGEHKILSQTAKPQHKPDNRLVVNYAKYIVDTLNGYFIGNPVKTVSDSDAVSDYVQLVERYNDIDDNNAELSKKCSIYGHAFELVFFDEEAQIGITNIDPKECFIVYDNSIRERPLFGVRYRVDKDKKITGTISDSQLIRYFEVKDDEVKYVEDAPNHFGEVPIVEYVENEERLGAFESVETLINAYNKAISEKANDVDYFADAYMKILGAILEEKDLVSIKDNRIINLASQQTDKLIVEFMEKPNADQTQEHLIERLERLIFAISMVANISEENFGVASGIALKYRLLSMSNLTNTKERKFVKGFNKRFKLISQAPNSKISFEDLIGIEYKFTRNIPENVKEEAEIATSLQGIISEETQLNLLSVVEDVKAEMDRKAEEDARVPTYDFERVMENEA